MIFLMFYLCECFMCTYVCVPQMYLVPTETRRGTWILLKMELQINSVDVLRSKLRSSVRVTSAINHWSLWPPLLFLTDFHSVIEAGTSCYKRPWTYYRLLLHSVSLCVCFPWVWTMVFCLHAWLCTLYIMHYQWRPEEGVRSLGTEVSVIGAT